MDVRPKLAVVGTGVVGGGVLKAWATRYYDVVGYDVNPETVKQLTQEGYNVCQISEFGECDADVVFICISTPQSDDGSIFLDYMLSGLEIIGQWITRRSESHYPMIVMRSTMLPNLSQETIIPALEAASGKTAGVEFGYAHLPEVLRETDALEDSLTMWQVVIGELDTRTGDMLEKMYTPIVGEQHKKLLTRVPVAVAESAKILMNTFNATIISYYNQMGLLLNAMGIDAQAAIDLSIRMGEGSLNSWYGSLTGKPYGGKCLPKDVAALLAKAQECIEAGADIPVDQLQATQNINDHMLELAAEGKVAEPIKAGFRRLSAQGMRARSVEAYDAFHAIQDSHLTKIEEVALPSNVVQMSA